MATNNWPGVQIVEDFELALSIATGETAIPAFACDPGDVLKGLIGKEFSSWLELGQCISKLQPIVTPEAAQGSVLYRALKTYFDNGGGRVYVMDVTNMSVTVPGYDDITLLVQAGTKADVFGGEANKICKPGNTYFAILDCGGETDAEIAIDGVATVRGKLIKNPYAAIYYPWLQADWTGKRIPPSAAVAGAYCAVDRERGVWKAPANVALKGGVRPVYKVSDELDGMLNVDNSGGLSINAIREFRGTGPLIWGARTLDTTLTTWKYVPVRRLFNAVEKDVRTSMGVAMFEPNSQPTWERVRGAIDNYLHALWKQGALMGTTPAQAYFVQVGLGVTMTQDDVLSGKMIVQIGLAAVRPAEFIIIQVSQQQLSAA
ncbi:phage tail sheath family protein [Burkholderia cenocepacia]|uniref:phage tail sheath family protein n=1 Tax=Burkholderia cenocepacia TaxID=95486 RepID=UPI000F5AAC19|nr:phage tail sheath C-terminal domain-containing protein [Burkholderia cenocepacia]RQU52925.1 phage tail sheath family protein [Burkholderia cenocepacia]RQV35045.1 phage tail sheath family protein [Burkholderia cenocepacia]